MSWETECDTLIVQPACMTQQDMSVPEVDRMLPILGCRLQRQEETGQSYRGYHVTAIAHGPNIPLERKARGSRPWKLEAGKQAHSP